MDVRNARNAVIEALPDMLSSMALLWGVVTREELQRRASDSGQSSKHTSTSVYFKSTKVCHKHTHFLQAFMPAEINVVWELCLLIL